MAKYSDFGIAVKNRLLELDKTQEWLIGQVRERTGAYFDTSYLYRILTGRTPGTSGRDDNPGKVEIIREILGMK